MFFTIFNYFNLLLLHFFLIIIIIYYYCHCHCCIFFNKYGCFFFSFFFLGVTASGMSTKTTTEDMFIAPIPDGGGYACNNNVGIATMSDGGEYHYDPADGGATQGQVQTPEQIQLDQRHTVTEPLGVRLISTLEQERMHDLQQKNTALTLELEQTQRELASLREANQLSPFTADKNNRDKTKKAAKSPGKSKTQKKKETGGWQSARHARKALKFVMDHDNRECLLQLEQKGLLIPYLQNVKNFLSKAPMTHAETLEKKTTDPKKWTDVILAQWNTTKSIEATHAAANLPNNHHLLSSSSSSSSSSSLPSPPPSIPELTPPSPGGVGGTFADDGSPFMPVDPGDTWGDFDPEYFLLFGDLFDQNIDAKQQDSSQADHMGVLNELAHDSIFGEYSMKGAEESSIGLMFRRTADGESRTNNKQADLALQNVLHVIKALPSHKFDELFPGLILDQQATTGNVFDVQPNNPEDMGPFFVHELKFRVTHIVDVHADINTRFHMEVLNNYNFGVIIQQFYRLAARLLFSHITKKRKMHVQYTDATNNIVDVANADKFQNALNQMKSNKRPFKFVQKPAATTTITNVAPSGRQMSVGARGTRLRDSSSRFSTPAISPRGNDNDISATPVTDMVNDALVQAFNAGPQADAKLWTLKKIDVTNKVQELEFAMAKLKKPTHTIVNTASSPPHVITGTTL